MVMVGEMHFDVIKHDVSEQISDPVSLAPPSSGKTGRGEGLAYAAPCLNATWTREQFEQFVREHGHKSLLLQLETYEGCTISWEPNDG
jgi:hypothetical protein